jgi:hypothetical protein
MEETKETKLNPLDSSQAIDCGLQIVVLDNGFIFIGEVMIGSGWGSIYNGYNVRKYGTRDGLPQLANAGEQAETVLDKCETVLRFPVPRLLFLLECNRAKWRNRFPE